MKLTIDTVAIREDGCFSVLLADGQPFAVSVERTFEDLRVIIPGGDLMAKRRFFNRGGYWTFEVLVPGHDALMFHKGAIEDHVEGCVAVGQGFTTLNDKTAIFGTEAGLAEFLRRTAGLVEFPVEVLHR